MARRLCGWCEQPAVGYAQIGEVWYCHSDKAGPSCYELAQFDAEVQANDARLFQALRMGEHSDGPANAG